MGFHTCTRDESSQAQCVGGRKLLDKDWTTGKHCRPEMRYGTRTTGVPQNKPAVLKGDIYYSCSSTNFSSVRKFKSAAHHRIDKC